MQPICQSATNTQDITQKHMPKCKNTADVIRQFDIYMISSPQSAKHYFPQCSNYTNSNSDHNNNNNNNSNSNSSNRLIIATVIAFVRVMVLIMILIIVIIIVIVMGRGGSWAVCGLWGIVKVSLICLLGAGENIPGKVLRTAG